MNEPKAYTLRNTHRTVLVMVVALSMLVTGCATPPALKPLNLSPLDAIQYMEQVLHTTGKSGQPFHAAVYYPFEHALRYPGLVIGVEQSDAPPVRDHFGKAAIVDGTLSDMPQFRDMLLDQSRVMFLSHVIRAEAVDAGQSGGNAQAILRRPCFVYNAYQPETDRIARYRSDIDQISLCEIAGADTAIRPTDNYFANGWLVLDRIRYILEQEISKQGQNEYTDVILIVMGWNTLQIEAIQNFNSLVDRLAQTRADRPFRPYVIGVTWPSQWVSETAKPVVEVASVFHKANDADELGGGWLAALLDHAIYPAIAGNPPKSGNKVPLTVIGHSYGARATSHAVCRGGFLNHPASPSTKAHAPTAEKTADHPANKESATKAKVQLLVGLQGAYSLNRFSAQGAGYYRMGYCNGACIESACPNADRLLFTASAYDSAAKLAAWAMEDAHFPAALDTYRQLCAANKQGTQVEPIQPRFTHWRANTSLLGQTRLTADPECQPEHANQTTSPQTRPFDYLDASDIIHRQALATGGDAHSDIYRTELARMIWEFMPQPSNHQQQALRNK